jgi:hypothetical protein
MASRDPLAVIPFSSGVAGDSLDVEELPDGDVLVGAQEPIEDSEEGNFDENIVEQLDARVLNSTASELISYYESDRAGRRR